MRHRGDRRGRPPAPAPNCTAADVAGVAAGVAAALSTYLYTHPDLNGFYTGLQDQPKDQIREDVQQYFNANPQEQADLENIRQPLADISNVASGHRLSGSPVPPQTDGERPCANARPGLRRSR